MRQTAKETFSRPSALLCISDPLAAYQFDAAVVMFGVIVENALQVEHNEGTQKEPRMVKTYTLPQLLDPTFRLPRPVPPPKPLTGVAASSQLSGIKALMAMTGASGGGVRAYKYVGPVN